MSGSSPLVSVGMPVYNGVGRVERALESLVDQTYPNIELIVCDDVSTDRTPGICRDFAEAHSFVRFVQNEFNLGAYHNFIKTLEMATGEYFLWADQEDYWAPELVSTLVAEFQTDSEIIAVMGAGKVLWEDGTEAYTVRLTGADKPRKHNHLANAISIIAKRYPKSNIVKNNLFIQGLIRRRAFSAAVSAYPGAFQNERQIICQLALAGRLVFVDKMLFERTTHRTKVEERRPPTDANVIAKSKPFPRIRYMYNLAISIIRSPIVPWYRKLYVPVILFYYVWTRPIMKCFFRVRSAVIRLLPISLQVQLKERRGRL